VRVVGGPSAAASASAAASTAALPTSAAAEPRTATTAPTTAVGAPAARATGAITLGATCASSEAAAPVPGIGSDVATPPRAAGAAEFVETLPGSAATAACENQRVGTGLEDAGPSATRAVLAEQAISGPAIAAMTRGTPATHAWGRGAEAVAAPAADPQIQHFPGTYRDVAGDVGSLTAHGLVAVASPGGTTVGTDHAYLGGRDSDGDSDFLVPRTDVAEGDGTHRMRCRRLAHKPP